MRLPVSRRWPLLLVTAACFLNAEINPVTAREGGGGENFTTTTTVSRQIVDMDCKQLNKLLRNLDKDLTKAYSKSSHFQDRIEYSQAGVREGNEKVSEWTRKAKGAKDSKEKRKAERKLKSSQRSLDTSLKDLEGFKAAKAETKKFIKSAKNDIRIAEKVHRKKKCKP